MSAASVDMVRGGEFRDRDAVGNFFAGIGETARTSPLTYGTPIKFDEYVNAPLTLPSAGAATS
jgi:hypothetical protein